MTATLDTPLSTTHVRGEATFLTAEGYRLTARQLVFVLAAHLARFGDSLGVKLVDPLTAIDAYMRFDTGARGDLTSWTTGRAPADIATVLARAEHIARDYFGVGFPAIPW
jgi:hypothetical protein